MRAVRLRATALGIALGLMGLMGGPAQAACRQALALGLDVSGSVDAVEYRLQLDGLAAALAHPEVRAALLALPDAPVRLAVYDWSGPRDQRLLLGWTEITGADVLDRIIAQLPASPRSAGDPSTAIGAAMQFGAALLQEQGTCWKRTLDLSGMANPTPGRIPAMSAAGLVRSR
ncbi:DUF1194 domain-containing protein [Puniceibacterium confluentis]|uniref:DUF1194 domain-containing protein n=1 Tax=Puniceibacterium confluentis TaxID=1958944 RepID=UPI001FE6ABED|nr:DUF1194 domain-containing protein [Puniceibacterium confluentis]